VELIGFSRFFDEYGEGKISDDEVQRMMMSVGDNTEAR